MHEFVENGNLLFVTKKGKGNFQFAPFHFTVMI